MLFYMQPCVNALLFLKFLSRHSSTSLVHVLAEHALIAAGFARTNMSGFSWIERERERAKPNYTGFSYGSRLLQQ
jgi:hypothetical protein